MAIDVRLTGVDDKGTPRVARIGARGFLQIAPKDGDPPPQGEASRFRFLSQLVSSVGNGTGTTSMNVNGTTPQKFTVTANQDYDIRMMKMVIFIRDTVVDHAGFGGLAALGTGLDISIFEAGIETFLIQGAKTFADLIRQTAAEKPFGNGTTAFELVNVGGVGGNDDAIILPMDLGSMVPGGVRIGRGTLDKLQVEVNDDLTGLTDFTVRVLGYRHYP